MFPTGRSIISRRYWEYIGLKKENVESQIDASMEFGIEVNAEKTEYM
jgi:hypothetical protein